VPPVLRFEPIPHEGLEFADTVLVVDVIRATTTAVAFLEAGANELWFAPNHDLALALKADGFVVAGETRGAKPAGFDLGNSPLEALRANVKGKRVVMSTTNGTRAASLAARSARRLALASLWNLDAAARWAHSAARSEIAVLASGKEGRFGLDDTFVAGALFARLSGEPDDGARAARLIFQAFEIPADPLRLAAAGRALEAIGLGQDVAAAAKTNRSQTVPLLAGSEGPYLVFRRTSL